MLLCWTPVALEQPEAAVVHLDREVHHDLGLGLGHDQQQMMGKVHAPRRGQHLRDDLVIEVVGIPAEAEFLEDAKGLIRHCLLADGGREMGDGGAGLRLGLLSYYRPDRPRGATRRQAPIPHPQSQIPNPPHAHLRLQRPDLRHPHPRRLRRPWAASRVRSATPPCCRPGWTGWTDGKPHDPVTAFFVDLERGDEAIELIRQAADHPSPPPHILAFGPHVRVDALAAARDAGAHQSLARGTFTQQLPALVTATAEN